MALDACRRGAVHLSAGYFGGERFALPNGLECGVVGNPYARGIWGRRSGKSRERAGGSGGHSIAASFPVTVGHRALQPGAVSVHFADLFLLCGSSSYLGCGGGVSEFLLRFLCL